MDAAIADGRIRAQLPFVKKKAVEALRAECPDRETAARGIADALTSASGATTRATSARRDS